MSVESVIKQFQNIHQADLEYGKFKRTMLVNSLVLVIVEFVWRMWFINCGVDKRDRETGASVVQGIA